MNKRDSIIKLLSLTIRNIFSRLKPSFFNQLQEIRLRINSPIIVIYKNKEYFVNNKGVLTNQYDDNLIITYKEIRETMEYISNYSLYAYEEEIRQGFLTVQGGHRIGIAGKVVIENKSIKNIKHISFINIRIANEIKGCADEVIPYLLDEYNRFFHTLIVSPPRCGKTTLLRDIIRQVSTGNKNFGGMNVGVVDERSEIGGSYMGVPQNDLGIRTDLLDCCPKAEGMLMLIRSMSPSVIAVDEIGSVEDVQAIEYVINSGCKLICTVHGHSMEDILKKPILNRLIQTSIFERYIILNNQNYIGEISAMYNQKHSPIFRKISKSKRQVIQ